MKQYLSKITVFGYAVFGLFLIRAFLNAVIPLMDKTEARYAEIARIMAETNNFITPQIDYGVSFWAKPPLSTWLSAISITFFGENEFAARLPYLLIAVAIVFLIGKYGRRNKLSFFLPGFILLTIPEFLLHAGVVSTDTALTFCVALTFLSFWEALQKNAKWYWKYLIFVGLGLGLLAKGPIVAILTLPPLFLWMLFCKKIKLVFIKISIILGALITLIIAVPWYLFAENATPGFLNYFVVGEHFKRFFDSGWTGDKYGFPKSQPLGMIWVFLLFFTIKWIFVLIKKLWQNRKSILKNEWEVFLLFWLLWTPIFFTFSKSLIHPYIMPVMVPIALLITNWFHVLKHKKVLLKVAMIFPVLSFLVVIISYIVGCTEFLAPTDKYLIQNNVLQTEEIYHLHTKSYSSQFYSKGKIKNITSSDLVLKIKENSNTFRIIIANDNFKNIDSLTQKELQKLDCNRKKSIYAYYKKQ